MGRERRGESPVPRYSIAWVNVIVAFSWAHEGRRWWEQRARVSAGTQERAHEDSPQEEGRADRKGRPPQEGIQSQGELAPTIVYTL